MEIHHGPPKVAVTRSIQHQHTQPPSMSVLLWLQQHSCRADTQINDQINANQLPHQLIIQLIIQITQAPTLKPKQHYDIKH
jgi:hypothetical protein